MSHIPAERRDFGVGKFDQIVIEDFWKMKSSIRGSVVKDRSSQRLCFCGIFPVAAFLCTVFIVGICFVALDCKEKVPTEIPAEFVDITRGGSSNDLTHLHPPEADSKINNLESTKCNSCKRACIPLGSEPLPKGIISPVSDLEVVPLEGLRRGKENVNSEKSLLAISVGIKQKEIVNRIILKFDSRNFTVMLFHYDGVVDEWKDLHWNYRALHISAINQTKWWFAKRFLHPDIVAPYKYIFLWDEDLEVENFNAERYLAIVEREGLEISQPALDPQKSLIHYRITARSRKGDVHRRMYKSKGSGRCYQNSTNPPCTGWVEMMAPVFSRAAWHCTWHMIQNDLIHAWGLDLQLGYCAQGDRSKKVGVVDSEYIVHKGLPTLGWFDKNTTSPDSSTSNDRLAVRQRSYVELETFRKRWRKAANEDSCWTDPYHEPKMNSTKSGNA